MIRLAIRVSRDDRKSPEFLKLNPAGAVPVLQDGDWVLAIGSLQDNIVSRPFEQRLAGIRNVRVRRQGHMSLAMSPRVLAVIDRLTPADTGRFLDYSGEPVPW